jgi:hypothetical protein
MEAESQWQGWDDFLRSKADDFGLAPIETEAFVKNFIRENLNKKVTQMKNDGSLNAKGIHRVYKKCKIKGAIPDKRELLLKQLENEYFQSKFASQSFNDKDVEITHVIDKLRDRCIRHLQNRNGEG